MMPPHNANRMTLTLTWAAQLRRVRGLRFLAFCFAGTLGFVADVAVLWLVLESLGLYLGRVVSFMVAVTVTWIVNRHLAFHDRRSGALLKEWGRYVIANTSGALANYGTYALLVATLPLFTATPALAVAAGSIAGLMLNFTASHLVVFQKKNEAGDANGL